jgi:hypothetical protein
MEKLIQLRNEIFIGKIIPIWKTRSLLENIGKKSLLDLKSHNTNLEN